MLRIDAETITFCDVSEDVKLTVVRESMPACCEKRGQLRGLVILSVNVMERTVSVTDGVVNTNTPEMEGVDVIPSTVLVTGPDSERGWSVVFSVNSVDVDSGVVWLPDVREREISDSDNMYLC